MKMHVVMDTVVEVEDKPAPVEESSHDDVAKGGQEGGEEAVSEDDGVDEEMLDALRAKLNVSPTLHAKPSMSSLGGGAADDGDDDDDDDAQFMAERERHGAIKSKSREL